MPATSDNDADGPAAAPAPAPTSTASQEPPGRDGRGAPAPDDVAGLTFRTFAWRWLVTFGLLLTFSVAWILVTPPIGGPDEQAHAVKAAAVASGQLTTQPDVARGGGYRLVRVPLRLASFEDLRGCFAFQPTVSADCAPSLKGSSRVGEVTTSAGLSPPLYYALVGAPLRLSPDLDGLYLARVLSAAIACALVATAIQLAASARSTFLLVAIAVAWTPLALSMTGIVSPSALELSAAVLTWVAGILLVRPGPLPAWLARWLVWIFAVAAVLFALSRQLSPLFLGCIVLVLFVAARPRRLRELAFDRRTWAPAVVVGLATAVAGAYMLLVQPGPVDHQPTDYGPGTLLAIPLGRLGRIYTEMVGVFGWLDAQPPVTVLLLWTAALAVVVVLGLAFGARRAVMGVLTCAVLSIVVPVVFEATQINAYGILFQGRYVLPLAMGVVLVAGRAVDEADARLVSLLARPALLVLVLTTVAHAIAIWFATRRFAVGTAGPVIFVGDERWDPGFPLIIPLVVGFAAMAGLAYWMWRSIPVPAGAAAAPAVGAPPAEPSAPPVNAEPSREPEPQAEALARR